MRSEIIIIEKLIGILINVFWSETLEGMELIGQKEYWTVPGWLNEEELAVSGHFWGKGSMTWLEMSLFKCSNEEVKSNKDNQQRVPPFWKSGSRTSRVKTESEEFGVQYSTTVGSNQATLFTYLTGFSHSLWLKWWVLMQRVEMSFSWHVIGHQPANHSSYSSKIWKAVFWARSVNQNDGYGSLLGMGGRLWRLVGYGGSFQTFF